MFDLKNLPITPEQARAARAYFGWSQAKVIAESGLRADKLKRFEAGVGKGGAYLPDRKFLEDLRVFYERHSYPFDDAEKPGAKAVQRGAVFPAGVVGGDSDDDEQSHSPASKRPVPATIHHMRIALGDENEMGHLLDMIEENEEKAKNLLEQPVEFTFLGGLSEATKKRHAQALRLMSENGVMFARLFGRDVGGQPRQEVLEKQKKPSTCADLLHGAHRDVHLACKGHVDAKERHKAKDKTLAETIEEAFGLT